MHPETRFQLGWIGALLICLTCGLWLKAQSGDQTRPHQNIQSELR
jgi:hypothetical protein